MKVEWGQQLSALLIIKNVNVAEMNVGINFIYQFFRQFEKVPWNFIAWKILTMNLIICMFLLNCIFLMIDDQFTLHALLYRRFYRKQRIRTMFERVKSAKKKRGQNKGRTEVGRELFVLIWGSLLVGDLVKVRSKYYVGGCVCGVKSNSNLLYYFTALTRTYNELNFLLDTH